MLYNEALLFTINQVTDSREIFLEDFVQGLWLEGFEEV